MVIFDLLGDTLMGMLLPRLVAEKIGFYLYHWKHVRLMDEMRKKMITFGGCVGVKTKYGNGLTFYGYRYPWNKCDDINNATTDKVAKLPRNYWYSNDIIEDWYYNGDF